MRCCSASRLPLSRSNGFFPFSAFLVAANETCCVTLFLTLPRIAWLLFVTLPLQPSSHHGLRGCLLPIARSSVICARHDWLARWLTGLLKNFAGCFLVHRCRCSLLTRSRSEIPFPRVAFTRRNGSTHPEPRQRADLHSSLAAAPQAVSCSRRRLFRCSAGLERVPRGPISVAKPFSTCHPTRDGSDHVATARGKRRGVKHELSQQPVRLLNSIFRWRRPESSRGPWIRRHVTTEHNHYRQNAHIPALHHTALHRQTVHTLSCSARPRNHPSTDYIEHEKKTFFHKHRISLFMIGSTHPFRSVGMSCLHECWGLFVQLLLGVAQR